MVYCSRCSYLCIQKQVVSVTLGGFATQYTFVLAEAGTGMAGTETVPVDYVQPEVAGSWGHLLPMHEELHWQLV